MLKFKFTDIGEGLHEGTITKIYLKQGDRVQEGDSLFSVETDKVTSDIPSPADGIISKILIEEGQEIEVGDIVFHIDDGSVDKVESVLSKTNTSNAVISQVSDVAANSNQLVNNSEPELDVIIIGSGPGGYTAASVLGQEGLKCAVIEKEKPGGVCLNIGCIPTKTLLSTAKSLHKVKIAASFGVEINCNNISLNWNKMQERKAKVVKNLNMGVEGIVRAAKAELIFGTAIIKDPNTIEVNGRILKTKNIIIASGSEPVVLPLPGFKEGYEQGILIDSTGALSFTKPPSSIVIIGGGVIGLEFAFLLNELGTKVTIIEGLPDIINLADIDIKKAATKLLKSKGIEIITSAVVKKWENNSIYYEINGKTNIISSEFVLVAVGRTPNNMDLGNTIGLEIGRRKEIIVNEFMQTNIPNIYAIGDVIGKAMLAHTAYKHAHIACGSIIKKDRRIETFNEDQVPGCIYTYPEISWIGKTEQYLIKNKSPYVKSMFQNSRLGKAMADDDTIGFTKLLIGAEYGEILGAHIINATSSDMISEIALAMGLEATVCQLTETIHPHPSTAEAIYEAALIAKAKFLQQKK